MCPLWPFHYVVIYAFLIWLLVTRVALGSSWKANFVPSNVSQLHEGASKLVYFDRPSNLSFDPARIDVESADKQIVDVSSDSDRTIFLNESDASVGRGNTTNLSFVLSGKFLGRTTVRLRAIGRQESKEELSDELDVSVIRTPSTVDRIFIISVAVLLGLNYINMGCSLDLDVVKATLKRPVGPVVGLISQYIFMPLMSFGLAHIIFTSPNMRLGLFTLGCSPGGGASNMWTYLLGGNLNLSITMTFLSNVLAFAAMPAWLFTLGRQIFDSSKIKIPYTNICTSLILIVLPVGIGLIVQRFCPRATKICRKALGPSCLFMIIFIIIFGTFANLYMFTLFTWRVIVGGLLVCWLGYAFGAILAKIFRFSYEDVMAISVETGVQNTGIAIILLKFSLPQPDADLTSVIPVASAIMMPIPLTLLFIIFRINKWRKSRDKADYESCKDTSGATTPQSDVYEKAIAAEKGTQF